MFAPHDDGKKLFGALLVENGLITLQQLQTALEEQQKIGGRLGFTLLRLGILSASQLVAFLEEHLGIGVESDSVEQQKAAVLLPRRLALYYKIAPIRLTEGTLTIAVSEIAYPNLLRILSDITGYKIDPLVYPEKEVRRMLEQCYRLPSEKGVEILSFGDHVFCIIDNAKGIKALAPAQLKNQSDAGEWLRSVIAEAIKEKSREILIQPDPRGAAVSFKRDTFFPTEFFLDSRSSDDLTFLIFGLARLNALQQQKPQYGRFQVRINERKVLMVASAFPTIYGMRFLLEMFDERMLRKSFEEFTDAFPELRNYLKQFFSDRKGLCIITGPEGSGRTPFLYSLLSRSKEDFQHIMTLENLVRYPISGISQTQVEDCDMDRALESILKQQPDLVAINALRTVRAVELAFLIAARVPVIAVMPCYDSFFAIEWLARHNLKSAVKAGLLHTLISPRLMPLVCPTCSVPFTGQERVTSALQVEAELRMNAGCEFCKSVSDGNSEPAFEVLRVDAEFLSWFEANQNSGYLRERARKSGRETLFDVALRQAAGGNLDVLSVLKLQSAL